MMAFLRKLSIRSQLLILATSTIIVILIIIFHTYSTMSGMITQNHEEYVMQTVSEIKKNVTSNKDVIYRLMRDISYNEDVQGFLVEKDALLRYGQRQAFHY
jgi:two-component system sensor histidine kinase YesM